MALIGEPSICSNIGVGLFVAWARQDFEEQSNHERGSMGHASQPLVSTRSKVKVLTCSTLSVPYLVGAVVMVSFSPSRLKKRTRSVHIHAGFHATSTW